MGITCPECRKSNTKVYSKYGDKRYRVCNDCGTHFTTIERYDKKTIKEILQFRSGLLQEKVVK